MTEGLHPCDGKPSPKSFGIQLQENMGQKETEQLKHEVWLTGLKMEVNAKPNK